MSHSVRIKFPRLDGTALHQAKWRDTEDMMTTPHIHHGGCLCGAIRFEALAPARAPHMCSCSMCQRHSGALTTAWVEFPKDAVSWTGDIGAPETYRSSDISSRAFCPRCGSSIGAIDDAPVIALLLGVFDAPDHEALKPTAHSFADRCPHWWKVEKFE